MQVNPYIAQMPAGYLFSEVAARVSEYESKNPGKNLIRMGIGDVTRPLGPSVAKAFSQAALDMGTDAGFQGYGPDGGYLFLREAIIQNDYQTRGIRLYPDEVFVSDGAKSDSSSIQELFALNALIAVTDPVYPVYVDSNAMAGRLGAYENGRWSRLVTLKVTHDNHFVPQLPQKRVDVLYLCLPNNPTGTVLDRLQLKTIVDWARENETLIVYDAAYKAFISSGDIPSSIYEVEGAKETAIECCSFSKTAGFTGTRCAYTVIPKELKGRMPNGERISLNALWKRRTGSKFNGVSYPVQVAAAAAYTKEGKKEIRQTIDYYRENAKALLDAFHGTECDPVGGVHAPYVWLRTPGGMSGWDFFDFLLRTVQVVGTPGEGFGEGGKGCFRLTAFSTHEKTKEAAQRIKDALRRL